MPAVEQKEWEAVLDWRFKCLRDFGLSDTDAEELALSHADLRDVKKLLEDGCPHNLLAPILA